jgi:hypothetical protein
MTTIFDDLIVPIGVLILVIAAVMAPLFGFAYWVGSAECSTYQQMTGKPTKYTMMACYINDSGQWYHWEEYKLRNATAGTAK